MFRFGQIEAALQVAHDIPESGQTAFRARLRHLFRAGLSLPGGRAGRRANFAPVDLFKMAFATELLQAGLMPERVTSLVTLHWPDAVELLFKARDGRGERQFLVAEPRALTDPLPKFEKETLETLSKRLLEGRRLIVNDIAGMYIRVIRAAEKVGIDMAALHADLDAIQPTILRDGAKVGPKSGFVEN